jgi:hypothetical protein
MRSLDGRIPRGGHILPAAFCCWRCCGSSPNARASAILSVLHAFITIYPHYLLGSRSSVFSPTFPPLATSSCRPPLPAKLTPLQSDHFAPGSLMEQSDASLQQGGNGRCETEDESTPHRQSLAQLSAELGIHLVNLYYCRKACWLQRDLVPASEKAPERRGATDKFTVVPETAGLNATELSAYCRDRGLYPDQVERWRQASQDANKKPGLIMKE